MDKIKKSFLFRAISIVLILTFVSLDISYAYPPEHNAGNSTLAIPSALQQQPINEQAVRFQHRNALITLIHDVDEYSFGNKEKGIGPLPSKSISYVMSADLEKYMKDTGIDVLNIVPVEYIKETASDKLKSALDEIGFKGTFPDKGVVFVLCKRHDKKFLLLIANKGEVSPENIPGHELEISDKLLVKYMFKDHVPVVESVNKPDMPVMESQLHKEYGPYAHSKWLYHSDRVDELLKGNFDDVIPVTAEFVPSLKCNYGCPTCTYGKAKKGFEGAYNVGLSAKELDVGTAGIDEAEAEIDKAMEKFSNSQPKCLIMDWETMKASLDRLKEGGLKAIIFTGGGEPLTNPNTIKGMRYAKSLGLKVALYTNGSLLTEDKVKELISVEPDFIRISFDAGTEKTFNLTHGLPDGSKAFNNVLKNLELLAKEKRARGSKTTIGVGVIINPLTAKEIDKTIGAIKTAYLNAGGGIDYIAFRPTVNYVGGNQYSEAIKRIFRYLKTNDPEGYRMYFDFFFKGEQFPEAVFDLAQKNIEQAGEKVNTVDGEKFVIPGTDLALLSIKSKLRDVTKPKSYNVCLAHSWFTEVWANGDVFLCSELNGNPEYRLGSLRDQSFKEIWDSERRKEVLRNIDINKKCPPVCKLHEYNQIFQSIQQAIDTGKVSEERAKIEKERANPVPSHVNYLSINPFAAIFGVAVLDSMFSMLKDFVNVHPVITGVTMAVVGTVLFRKMIQYGKEIAAIADFNSAEINLLKKKYKNYASNKEVLTQKFLTIIKKRVDAASWISIVDRVKFLSSLRDYVIGCQSTISLKHPPMIWLVDNDRSIYGLKISRLEIYPYFVERIVALDDVWPELAQHVFDAILTHEEGHIENYRRMAIKHTPSGEVMQYLGYQDERDAFNYLVEERGKKRLLLTSFWFQAYLNPSYELEEHTEEYFRSFFKFPFYVPTDEDWSYIMSIEKEYAKRAADRRGTGTTTLNSFNPLIPIFGVAALGSIFSAVKDFVSAHPIITGIAAFAIGIAVFFAIWHKASPTNVKKQELNSESIKNMRRKALDIINESMPKEGHIYTTISDALIERGVALLDEYGDFSVEWERVGGLSYNDPGYGQSCYELKALVPVVTISQMPASDKPILKVENFSQMDKIHSTPSLYDREIRGGINVEEVDKVNRQFAASGKIGLGHSTDFPQYKKDLVGYIRKIFGEELSILSVGAGRGDLELALQEAGNSVTAIEYFEPFAREMKAKGVSDVIQEDARVVLKNGQDIAGKKFDLIIFSESIGTLGLDILNDAAKFTKDDGSLLVTDYNFNGQSAAEALRKQFPVNRIPAETIAGKMEEATSHDVVIDDKTFEKIPPDGLVVFYSKPVKPNKLFELVENVRDGNRPKNINQLEADKIIGSIIFLARNAKHENKKLYIGLETEWIPGINEETGYGSQHDAINLLLKEIKSIGDVLRGLGLDNVEIVEGSSQTLAGTLLKKAGSNLSNVVVLASAETISSADFNDLRSTPEEKRAFLAGVDASEMMQHYKDHKKDMERMRQQLEIRIMEMLSITLELAVGKTLPKLPLIFSYDEVLRVVIFMPKAEVIDYEVLKSNNGGRIVALRAA